MSAIEIPVERIVQSRALTRPVKNAIAKQQSPMLNKIAMINKIVLTVHTPNIV